MKILIVQGANMAYLGKRQPEIYGSTTAAELDDILHKHADSRGYTLEIFYTHIEGEAIGRTYQAHGRRDRWACHQSRRLSPRRLCIARLPAFVQTAARRGAYEQHRQTRPAFGDGRGGAGRRGRLWHPLLLDGAGRGCPPDLPKKNQRPAKPSPASAGRRVREASRPRKRSPNPTPARSRDSRSACLSAAPRSP